MANACPAIDSLDVAEAYSLAITIEDEGYKFYDALAEKAESVQAKNELNYLRDEEKKHKAMFEKCLKDSGEEYKRDESSVLHCWADEEIIKPMADALNANTPATSSEALRLGVQLEGKTIEFLESMKQAVKDKESLDAIKTVIKEEKKHKKRLNIILAY
jgi:rubrerythrin